MPRSLFYVLVLALLAMTLVAASFDETDYDNESIEVNMPDISSMSVQDIFRNFYADETLSEHYQVTLAASKNVEVMAARRQHAHLMLGMTLEAYDAQYTQQLDLLSSLASQLDIKYNPYTTSFSDLCDAIHTVLETRPHSDQLLATLYDIEDHKDLFAGKVTLLPAGFEEAVLRSWINLDKAVNWIVSHLRSNKCAWCKKLASYVRKGACAAAGRGVCYALALIGAEFAPLLQKFVCGLPVRLSSVFGKLCQKGVSYLQRNLRASDYAICHWLSFPTISWRTINNGVVHITGRTVRLGHPC